MSIDIIKLGIAATLVLATLSVGCGKDKADALAELQRVKQACDSNDRQHAQDLMLAAAGKNKTFAKSFQFVTADLPDKTMVDACGPIFDKVKAHLEDQ
jgi:hypothetical protein